MLGAGGRGQDLLAFLSVTPVSGVGTTVFPLPSWKPVSPPSGESA